MTTDKRYAAVLEAIRLAEIEASEAGWSGVELRAHAFIAAFDAVSGKSAEQPEASDEQSEGQERDQ
jgi:hypothetical protein